MTALRDRGGGKKRQAALPRLGLKRTTVDLETTALATTHLSVLKDIYSQQAIQHSLSRRDGSIVSTLLQETPRVPWYDIVPLLTFSIAVGLWVPQLNGCVLIRRRGSVLHHCINRWTLQIATLEGDTHESIDVLYPEETLFLMERRSLVVFHGETGNLWSIQEMYWEITAAESRTDSEDILPLVAYAAYAYLRRLGIPVKRIFNNTTRTMTTASGCSTENPQWWEEYYVKIKQQLLIPRKVEPLITEDLDVIGYEKKGNKRLMIHHSHCSDDEVPSVWECLHLTEPLCLWMMKHRQMTSKSTDLEVLLKKHRRQHNSQTTLGVPICIINADTPVRHVLLQLYSTGQLLLTGDHDNSLYESGLNISLYKDDQQDLHSQQVLFSISSESTLPILILGTMFHHHYTADQYHHHTDCLRTTVTATTTMIDDGKQKTLGHDHDSS